MVFIGEGLPGSKDICWIETSKTLLGGSWVARTGVIGLLQGFHGVLQGVGIGGSYKRGYKSRVTITITHN